MKELKKSTKGITDVVADYNSKSLFREVETPYPIYNGYFEEASKFIGTDELTSAEEISFTIGAKEVYYSNCKFRLLTSLMAYCDYISLITKDKVSNVFLYESLKGTVNTAIDSLDGYTLFTSGVLNEKTLYNFSFSFGSIIFNETVEFLYRYNIPLTEKLYHDLSMANIIYNETLSNDLAMLMSEFTDYGYIYNNLTLDDKKTD